MARFLATRKARIGVGVYVVILAMVPATFAYWTSTGEGAGVAVSNHASAPFEVTSSPTENLSPGASAPVTVDVKDADANQREYLTRLEVEVGEPSVAACKREWFEVTPTSQEAQVLVAPGEIKEYTLSLRMKEEPVVNQNACRGALIPLHYRAS